MDQAAEVLRLVRQLPPSAQEEAERDHRAYLTENQLGVPEGDDPGAWRLDALREHIARLGDAAPAAIADALSRCEREDAEGLMVATRIAGKSATIVAAWFKACLAGRVGPSALRGIADQFPDRGGREHVELFEEALHGSWECALEAARRLVRLGEGRRAIGPLKALLTTDHAHHALDCLAAMGGEAAEARPEVRRALRSTHWWVRASAARALGAIGAAEADDVQAMIRMLDGQEFGEAAGAIGGLAKLRSKEAVPHLLRMVRADADMKRRADAASALVAIDERAVRDMDDETLRGLVEAAGAETFRHAQVGAVLKVVGERGIAQVRAGLEGAPIGKAQNLRWTLKAATS